MINLTYLETLTIKLCPCTLFLQNTLKCPAKVIFLLFDKAAIAVSIVPHLF